MNTLKHALLIAAMISIPTLSFAQQMSTPSNAQTGNATMQATPDRASSTLGQQPANGNAGGAPAYQATSGYGAPAYGSTESSPMRFVGKHSRTFDH